jgi:cyclic pyranopterin phosphate synthase
MRDSRNREIDYLRLSVTDRCNLRCVYCMPPSGVELVSHDDILSVEETVRLAGIITRALGIRKVRITGGEPLVRKGVTEIIRGISRFGVEELALTTNGILLGGMAEELSGAGVRRVNVSLDSLRDERIGRITRSRVTLSDIESGIRRAADAGMTPVKVNCVVIRGWNDDETVDFLRWGRDMGLTVRFIEHMPSMLPVESFVPRDEILDRASALGTVHRMEPEGETAGRYRIGDTGMVFGIVAPHSDDICRTCRRIRLSAEGVLYPCLSRSAGTPLRDLLRRGSDDEKISETVRETVLRKPEGHGGCFQTEMWKIGG